MNQLKSQSSGSNIAPLVSVIVPHFNGIDILDACLNSLLQDPYPALEIIVVDNGSLDGSPDFVAEKF
ncbi:MAG: glycosyltransferase, partial [Candidatus Marinimicrobia bacterium]|nr:glycosyltransferase [Candidatus Neomarinimicrobiota bacterium]